jgi:hypothetical protein
VPGRFPLASLHQQQEEVLSSTKLEQWCYNFPEEGLNLTTDKNNSYIEKLAAGIARKAVQDAIKAINGKPKEVKTATAAAATAEAAPVAAAQVSMTEKITPAASAPTATTEKAAPEATAQAAIAIETEADPAAEAKCAYIFFNCDASKAPASMNIRFNNEVYRDYPAGREDLLAKVEAELAAGNIKIADWEAVRKAILEGQPTEASALMEFGCIECLIMS